MRQPHDGSPVGLFMNLSWKDRIVGAGWIGLAYLLAILPLAFGAFLVLMSAPFMKEPALVVAVLCIPYLLLPIPAMLTLMVLRIAKAPFGGLSLVALPLACSALVTAGCLAQTTDSFPETYPAFVRPSMAVCEALLRSTKKADQGTGAVIVGTAFLGGIIGSFWTPRARSRR